MMDNVVRRKGARKRSSRDLLDQGFAALAFLTSARGVSETTVARPDFWLDPASQLTAVTRTGRDFHYAPSIIKFINK